MFCHYLFVLFTLITNSSITFKYQLRYASIYVRNNRMLDKIKRLKLYLHSLNTHLCINTKRHNKNLLIVCLLNYVFCICTKFWNFSRSFWHVLDVSVSIISLLKIKQFYPILSLSSGLKNYLLSFKFQEQKTKKH